MVDFPSQVMPEDFNEWCLQLSCLELSTKRIVWNTSLQACLLSMGKTLNRMTPSLCDRAKQSSFCSAPV